jgi:hypothetical protein
MRYHSHNGWESTLGKFNERSYLLPDGKSSLFVSQIVDSHIRPNLDMLKTRSREKLMVTACLAVKSHCVVEQWFSPFLS